MRLGRVLAGIATALSISAGAAVAGTPAQEADRWRVREAAPQTVGELLSNLDRRAAFDAGSGLEFGPEPQRLAGDGAWAATNRDVWIEGDGYRDRLRLRTEGVVRRADGAPAPLRLNDAAMLDDPDYDVSYVRGWPQLLSRSETGVEVAFTPHAGVGLGSRGGSAEAGATLEIGRDLERLAPDGSERFGERPRWYLYAAGSGRAVGYNWARTRDGDFARSGMSQDTGSFLGDASIGMAMRKGAMHSSVGLVYREVGVEGLRAGHGVDTDVSEGMLAFQFSIKPE